jgi:hypothetical protein
MKVNAKFEVIKGGVLHVDGYPIRLKVGEIWDIVQSDIMGPQFRKLNQRGGCVCILNGNFVALAGLDAGKLKELSPDDPKAIAHDELRKRTNAR